MKKKKREWMYVQQPYDYEIRCDICGGSNITWSEYEGYIWCYGCRKDTPGTGGVFDGPIPLATATLLGMNFSIVYLETGKVETPAVEDGKIVWKTVNPKK